MSEVIKEKTEYFLPNQVKKEPEEKELQTFQFDVCPINSTDEQDSNTNEQDVNKESSIRDVHEKKIPILKCIMCHDDFSNKEALKTHIASVHEGKKPSFEFKCDTCDATFSVKEHLKRHKQFVHSSNPFKCDFCEDSFSRGQELKAHLSLIHEDKISFKCSKCNYVGSALVSLNNHIASVHESTKQNLEQKHHNSVLKDEKPFKCDKCQSTFSQKENLKTHKLFLHGIKGQAESILTKFQSETVESTEGN